MGMKDSMNKLGGNKAEFNSCDPETDYASKRQCLNRKSCRKFLLTSCIEFLKQM